MRTIVTALAALCCAASPAVAATSKPHFAKTYRGSASGTLHRSANGQTLDLTWQVSGLSFRLTSVRSFEGGWTGIYKVTGGKVSFGASATDSNCAYSAHSNFGLARSLPRPNPSVPFALDKGPLGRYSILGMLDPDKQVTATAACGSDSGDTQAAPMQIDVPDLLNAGEKGWRPGRRIKGTYTIRDSGEKRTWNWSLRPGR
jgi:hypothetical protein